MNYVNCTPHAIVLNDGRKFAPSGSVARVSAEFLPVDFESCLQVFGEVSGLPEEAMETRIIVSAMVFAASSRMDLVAPATGHPDTVRNDKGHIVSVPCFVVRS